MRNRILKTELLPDQAALFYLGQLGFLIKWNGKYLLIDAYLTDVIDRKRNFVPEWTRCYPVPIAPQELDFVDYVFCTHAHTDHADPETLAGIAAVNHKAKYIVSEAIVEKNAGYGVDRQDIIGLECDKKVLLEKNLAVTAIPAAHEELHPVKENVYEEVGFLMELGEIRLYHSGDCCPYAGLEKRVQNCDIMILPVNGRDYYRRYEQNIIGCFDCKEAALLAKNTGAGLLIPAHIDLYPGNSLNPAIFVEVLKSTHPTQRFHVFAPGERFLYQKEEQA